MATSSGLPTIDLGGKQNAFLDNLALMFLPWFTAMHFGVLTTNLGIFGGYDFSAAIWSPGGMDVSVSVLAILFGLGWILATNQIDGSDYEPVEFAVIGFALISPLLYILMPAFESLVMWNGISQLFWTFAVTAAATWIGYTS